MQTVLICITILILIAFSIFGGKTAAIDFNDISEKIETAEVEKFDCKENAISLPLNQIAKSTLMNHFGQDAQFVKSCPTLNQFYKQFVIPVDFKTSNGLFVTFYKDGKTRACWGSTEPVHENLIKATIFASEDAIRNEYRHAPIKASELNAIACQVTVITDKEPISSIHDLNPFTDGLLVQADGRGAVILPGEAASAHHQLVMAKLKAGIHSNQSCQLYRLKTNVYR